MAEPSDEQDQTEFKGIKCPFENLQRSQIISWYLKTITEHTNKLERNQPSQNDAIRRDTTLVEWDDALSNQLLF